MTLTFPSTTLNMDTYNLDFGYYPQDTSDSGYWHGIIDEIRFLQHRSSANRIATEYNKQAIPSSFSSVSSEQTQITMN